VRHLGAKPYVKIIYLHQYFNTPAMSGGTRSYELGRRLVSMGHEVRVVTSLRDAQGPSGWRVTQEDGLEVHWLSVPYSNHMGVGGRLKAFLSFAISASLRSARLPGDVVYATSTPLSIALPGFVASGCGRRPMVFEIRDLWPDVPVAVGAVKNPALIWGARILERFAYRSASSVVALAPGMADHVKRAGGTHIATTVIPNGCDIDRFGGSREEARARIGREYGWVSSTERPLLLYAGAIGDVNDIEFVIDCSRELDALGFDFDLAVLGDGRRRPKAVAMAKSNGLLDKKVHFLGNVSKEEVADWYAASVGAFATFIDIPVLFEHAVLNKFFDALAAGRPVFANFSGFVSRVAADHGAGVILARDPTAAALTLRSILKDSSRLDSMGAAARELAQTTFNRDDHARTLEGVLRRAVGQRTRAPAL